MNVTNVVYAVFGSSRHTVTEKLHQWDKGQVLKFKNLSDLPEYYAVHFSNERVGGVAKTFIGNSNGVGGWDEYLETGKPVYAWLYLSAGEDDGKTMRSVEIPVVKRPRPVDIEPTPQEQSQIDVIIDALNSGVTRAETAATNAETSEDNAKESELAAKASEEAALQAKDDAEAAKTEAEEAEATATQKATEAEGSANRASNSATLSESWAVGGTNTRQGEDTNNAKYYAESTISAKDDAVLAKNQAESARDLAAQAKDSAQASAQTATRKASEAFWSAADASESASSASASSASASQSASLATSAKEAAETAQGLAEDARDEAVTAKDEAETAQQEAEAAAQSISEEVVQIAINTQDISDLKSAVNQMYPTDTASGAIASFPDGAKDVPVDSLKVGIEPVQDLHGYDHPWPAGGGENKLLVSAETILKPSWYTANWTGVSLNNKNGITQTRRYADAGAGGVAVTLPAGTYTYSHTYTGSASYCEVFIAAYDGTSMTNVANNVDMQKNGNRFYYTFTIPSGNTEFCIRPSSFGGEVPYDFTDMQLELGTTATSYTPYSNLCPISGHEEVSVVRCGKNLFDGSILVEKVAWQYIELPLKEGTYTFSCTLPTNTAEFAMYFIKVGGSPDSITRAYLNHPVTITLDEGEIAQIQYRRVSGTGVFSDYTYQLELGSTATAYEPYQSQSYTIELGDTIYGGVLDVTKGELTVDRAMVDLGTLNWTARTSGEKNRLYSSSLPQEYVPDYSLLRGWICDTYVENSPSSAAILQQDVDSRNIGLYSYRSTGAKSTTLYLITPKTASPQGTLVYELATPQTIQLTPQQISTLYGTNNIWADTGDTEVTYKADVQLYIQKMIQNAINALS